MPLDLKLFADKLRRYRAQLEASLEDVAASTGLSIAALSALEDTRRPPTGDEVLVLADYFKCDYKFLISNEQLAPLEQTDKLFRKLGDQLTRDDRWAIQEFLYLCECEAFLQTALERPAPHVFSFTKRGKYFKAHGEQAAMALRHHLEYAPHAIPVDVFADFRRIGIHVFRRQISNSAISGLYLKHPTAGKCVLVNYSEDVFRQRFTVAHEAGHSILDAEEDFVVSLAWDQLTLVEVRANTFAGHFLLPPEYLQRMPLREWHEAAVLEAAKSLYVNVDTLLIALQRENRLTKAAATNLKRVKVPQRDKQDPELPASATGTVSARKEALLRRGLSSYYAQLCFEAYSRELVTASRVAEMMLTDEAGLAEVGELFGWSPKHGA